MLRAGQTGSTLLLGASQRAEQSVLLQCVRFRRRRWAPISHKRVFWVREPPKRDPEEWPRIKKAMAIYRTEVKGIKQYLRGEMEAKEVASVSPTFKTEEEQHFSEALAENDMWNQETGKKREARQAKQEAENQQTLLEDIIRAEKEKEKKAEKAKQHVLMEMERSKYFINADNLEEEIEKALNMRINYNFAIDSEGNRYIELPDGSTNVETKESEPVQTFPELTDPSPEQKETAV